MRGVVVKDRAKMGNVVELRTPQGRESLGQLLELVTVKSPEDIHDAAVVMEP